MVLIHTTAEAAVAVEQADWVIHQLLPEVQGGQAAEVMADHLLAAVQEEALTLAEVEEEAVIGQEPFIRLELHIPEDLVEQA